VDFRDGPSARKGFICNWGDRYTVARGLLGLNTATLVGGRITISVPAHFPEIPYMYCHTIEFEPKGAPFEGAVQAAWPKVIVWANYKCTPWNFSGIDDPGGQNQFPGANYIYAEQQLNSSAEYLTVPGHSTLFKTSGKPTGADFGFRIALVDMIITFHRVPYLPAAQAFSLAGLINNAPFLGVDTGKCMFNGYRTHQTRNTDGTVATDVTAMYQARSIRWDYGFDGAAPRFDQVVWPDGTTPFIQSTDLTVTVPSSYID
jgi:hypothetical protein